MVVKQQKLTSDLAGTEQQKKVLEMELKHWRQSTFLQQPAPTVSVTADGSCQAQAAPALANAASQTLEAEVKQLQAKVKVGVCVTGRTRGLMTCPYPLSYCACLIR